MIDANIIIILQQNPYNLNLTQYIKDNLKDKIMNKLIFVIQSKNDVQKQCSICIENVNVINVLLPCGHGVFCSECVSKLINKECPYCRTTVNKSQIIYL